MCLKFAVFIANFVHNVIGRTCSLVNNRMVAPKFCEVQQESLIFFLCRLEVPTMAGKFELPIGYSQELECRVLELPFSKKRISMFLLLPDDAIDGLNRLEANISTENIQHLLGTLKVR